MKVARFYARHRRAWTPRLWPLLIASGGLSVAVNALFVLTVAEAVVAGFGIAFALGTVRWEVWKHRHPVISHAEFITDLTRDLRESARWN